MQKPGSSGLNVRLWRFISLATAQQRLRMAFLSLHHHRRRRHQSP